MKRRSTFLVRSFTGSAAAITQTTANKIMQTSSVVSENCSFKAKQFAIKVKKMPPKRREKTRHTTNHADYCCNYGRHEYSYREQHGSNNDKHYALRKNRIQ